MDYSLVRSLVVTAKSNCIVLILVVMDYSLVRYRVNPNAICSSVLILVVMDYSLVPSHIVFSAFTNPSLNPCCNGL